MNINKIRQYLSEAKSPPWYMGLHKSQKGVFFRGEDPKDQKIWCWVGCIRSWNISYLVNRHGKGICSSWGKGVVVKFKVPTNLKNCRCIW